MSKTVLLRGYNSKTLQERIMFDVFLKAVRLFTVFISQLHLDGTALYKTAKSYDFAHTLQVHICTTICILKFRLSSLKRNTFFNYLLNLQIKQEGKIFPQ